MLTTFHIHLLIVSPDSALDLYIHKKDVGDCTRFLLLGLRTALPRKVYNTPTSCHICICQYISQMNDNKSWDCMANNMLPVAFVNCIFLAVLSVRSLTVKDNVCKRLMLYVVLLYPSRGCYS